MSHPFPDDFVRLMEQTLGPPEAAALVAALRQEAPVSIRLNAGVGSRFAADGSVAWCAAGRYLQPPRPAFTFDPWLHAGAYYVQEAASMFVEQAARRILTEMSPRRVLDLCAAPGGKTTLWRSLLPDDCLLVANEPLRQRASVLLENVQKWGHPDVAVTCAWPAELGRLTDAFDVVAADVPCSGEGMFRKDAGAVAEWSMPNVEQCAARQRDIIRQIWPALRAGGFLVYSTCTFNPLEDEHNVSYICRELGAEPVPIAVEPHWGTAGDTTGGTLPVYHFFPHRARGEGFFLALLRKSGDGGVTNGRRRSVRSSAPAPAGSAALRGWLREPDGWALQCGIGGRVEAVRKWWADWAQSLRATVNTLVCGVELAELKGHKAVPAAALALSRAAAPDAFEQTDLDLAAALSYLRRESLTLPASLTRGYVRVAYEGRPLGFVNHLGARANNLYPAAWRIRSAYGPDAAAPAE